MGSSRGKREGEIKKVGGILPMRMTYLKRWLGEVGVKDLDTNKYREREREGKDSYVFN